MALTLREEIVAAIREGLGDTPTTLEEFEDATDIHVDGFDEPITVWRDDVTVPECYGDLVHGIALDVAAILAGDQLEAGS